MLPAILSASFLMAICKRSSPAVTLVLSCSVAVSHSTDWHALPRFADASSKTSSWVGTSGIVNCSGAQSAYVLDSRNCPVDVIRNMTLRYPYFDTLTTNPSSP